MQMISSLLRMHYMYIADELNDNSYIPGGDY